MSIAIIDLASFISGLGANVMICDQATFAMGSAAGIEIPTIGLEQHPVYRMSLQL